MVKANASSILQKLQSTLPTQQWSAPMDDPFKTLIATIISQNTSNRNTQRAFENLSKKFEINPETLAKAQIDQIEERLRVGGLYKNKAKTIKKVSQSIVEKFNGSLSSVLNLPFESARKALMQLPGVGPKTADVVLLFCANQPTIPVDTHVDRVSKRLGLAPSNGNYEAVRASLQTLYLPQDYFKVHVMLIAHGRRYCRARNPLCTECPINIYCPSRTVKK